MRIHGITTTFLLAFLVIGPAVLAAGTESSGMPPFPDHLKNTESSNVDLDELYFGRKSGGRKPAPLSRKEMETLALIRRWQEGQHIAPTQAVDGTVRFFYGAAYPSIVCAVMQVTDIELEPGEEVQAIHLGDATRWMVEPAVTGNGPTAVQHLVVKPADVGLETSVLVTTSVRTYHLKLKSTRKQYMPKVAFVYPDRTLARFQSMRIKKEIEREQRKLPDGEYLDNLDFNYRISADSDTVKPLRVYNDGQKTIIQMPKNMAQGEAPALLAISGKDDLIVNYRLQGDRYIVDSLPAKMKLIAGVGRKQKKIEITRIVKDAGQ